MPLMLIQDNLFHNENTLNIAGIRRVLLPLVALDMLEWVLAHLDQSDLHIAAAHVAAAIDVVREEIEKLETAPCTQAPVTGNA